MGCCLALFSSSSSGGSASSSGATPRPPCCFDTRYVAAGLTLMDGRLVVEGEGTALCDTPVDQLRAYWEFTVRDFDPEVGGGASFAVGVMRRANLKPPPNDKGVLARNDLGKNERSKALRSTECGVTFGPGDVLGVSLDMNYKRMRFFLNGAPLQAEIKLSPRFSAPYPAVSLSRGVRLEANFSGGDANPFQRFPAAELKDYSGLVAAQSLL